MAQVIKHQGGAPLAPLRAQHAPNPANLGIQAPQAGTNQPSQLALPAEKSQPLSNLGDYTWLVYGEKKIGKTSLAAQFPEALFMMFEPGGKGLSIYQKPITSWSEFKNYIALLRQSDRFRTIVIDTVDIAYERCMAYVGNREGFSHPSDMNDFGKSWQLVSREFANTIYELVGTGRGVMFISHAKESEFQEASGAKYNKIIPTMSGQARGFVSGFVDIISYYGYYGAERLLTISGSDAVDAGHRLEGHFLVSNNSGSESVERVHSIPMGSSPAEGYDNIVHAFNNQQEQRNAPEKKTGLSEAPVKRQGRR